jgi:hypothetical protein
MSDGFISKSEYIQAKVNLDSMTLGKIMNQMEVSEAAIQVLMDNIQMGDVNPKLFDALGNLQRTFIDLVKTQTAYIENAEIEYKKIAQEKEVSPDDIVDNELIEDGGYITTSETIQGEYFVKGVEGTKMLVSTEITFTKASQTELYPKCGIVFSTTDKTELTDNKLVIFLNSEIGNNGTSSWNDFGVCEIQNGGNWAWNPGVTDANARHKNALYKTPEPVTYGTKFTLTVARDGFDFHIWVNDVYAGSITVLEDLFGVYEDGKFVPAASYAGFFQFNSVVKFENYSATADAAAVDAKVASIAEKTYVTEWDKDAA